MGSNFLVTKYQYNNNQPITAVMILKKGFERIVALFLWLIVFWALMMLICSWLPRIDKSNRKKHVDR
jgi:hypothetical protein